MRADQGANMTLKPNPVTGVLGVLQRDDVDVAAQAEFVEQLPGETEFDQIAKAQASPRRLGNESSSWRTACAP